MSQKSSGPLSKFNLALALLWLVDVAVTVAGYLILTSSNESQAEFYTNQSADYVTYFSAQSGSTLGATLIGAGALGFIVTLAAHVLARAITRTAASVVPVETLDTEPEVDFDDIEFDTADETTPPTDSVTTGSAKANSTPADAASKDAANEDAPSEASPAVTSGTASTTR
jgi:hypothetical protein